MSWMSTPAKKAKNTPKKQKHNNVNNTKYQNVNYRGPSFLFSLPAVVDRPLTPPSITPLGKPCGRECKISLCRWHGVSWTWEYV